jgi:hypothetical protein
MDDQPSKGRRTTAPLKTILSSKNREVIAAVDVIIFDNNKSPF